MDDCLFCEIIKGNIPSKKIFEDEYCFAFYDISPKAPIHFLIIPKIHIESVDAIEDEHKELIGHLFIKIKEITKDLGLNNGYRVVSNIGDDGLQTVKHLHFHVLGGKKMGWPPG